MAEPRFDDAPLAMIRRVGKDALAAKMIGLFLESAPVRVAAIAESAAAGDLTTAGRGAHSLKSSAGQLGAVSLQELCQRIEQAAKEGDAAAVGAIVPDLSPELDAAVAWLRAGAPPTSPPAA